MIHRLFAILFALAAGTVCAVAMGQDAPLKITRNHALCATVGVRIGPSHGSGTIIHAAEGRGLVVTCWHVFREYQQGEEILVDVFGPVPCVGKARALGMDQQTDVAVLEFEAQGFDLVSVPLAPRGLVIRPGDQGFSIGCGHSGSPIAFLTTVTAVGRYVGGDNFSTSGLQTEGRSGGGMFAHGALCGVINAADPSYNEGLYAGLRSIYGVLDRAGLQETQYRVCPPQGCPTPQYRPPVPPSPGTLVPVQPRPVTPPTNTVVKGDRGDAGAPGAKGDKGDKGDKGEPGISPDVALIVKELIEHLPPQEQPQVNLDIVVAEVLKRLPPIYANPDDKTGTKLGGVLPPFTAQVKDGSQLLPGDKGTRQVYLGQKLPIKRSTTGTASPAK